MDTNAVKVSNSSGIYRLVWPNEYFYIGQATNLQRRWSGHKTGFGNGHMKSHQAKLYNVWLKHGEPIFTVVEHCTISNLNDLEQQYITANWGNPLLCNTSPSSCNSRGSKRVNPPWNKGVPMASDMKKRLSSVKKGLNAGTKHAMCKLTNNQVIEIRAKYVPFKYTADMLGAEYGVGKGTILSIVNSKTWSHLPPAAIEHNKEAIASEGVMELNGISKNLHQWALHLGLDYLTLYQRVKKYNWPLYKALRDPSCDKGQKLTADQVKEIRQKYIPFKNGSIKLGKEYGVSNRTILYIIKNQRYANVLN